MLCCLLTDVSAPKCVSMCVPKCGLLATKVQINHKCYSVFQLMLVHLNVYLSAYLNVV